jgi:hypothetical protein
MKLQKPYMLAQLLWFECVLSISKPDTLNGSMVNTLIHSCSSSPPSAPPTSQPSAAMPLQSAKSALHMPSTHLPPPHAGAALGKGLQVLKHTPQLVAEDCRLVCRTNTGARDSLKGLLRCCNAYADATAAAAALAAYMLYAVVAYRGKTARCPALTCAPQQR